ncbi:hypothetical protein MTR67_022566 [Solanum verrucosum]|uniref:Uncharacterized protein n=1 Tax=Solanum verrucosum TaxID=315347 RepID=A0AAF0TQW0_SOLVR|nr:hypothetical protein MTR67_022566 [Solanum verrucosum]
MWWQPKGGTSSIWFDNWTRLGPVFAQPTKHQTCHNMIDIEIFLNDNRWGYDEMQMHIPTHVVEHVKQNMKYVRQDDVSDRPWWTKTCSGKFTVKSAWELPRKRKMETDF